MWLCLLGGWVVPAHPQESTRTPTGVVREFMLQGQVPERPLGSEEQAFDRRARRGSELPEGVVDPTAYRLGPGDGLRLHIWGPTEQVHELEVLPEGSVFVPNVGLVAVHGLALALAREEIRDAVLAVYSGVRVDVVLTTLRRFKVHVSGAVFESGCHAANAVTRASEVIELAGGLLPGASFREAVVRHADGRVERVDLVAYHIGGNLERNPFVSDGAVIDVPKRVRSVRLSGAVVNPGPYEPLPGERLSELLTAAGGLRPGVDSTRVMMSRFETPSVHTERILAYRPGGGDATDPALRDGDGFFFRRHPDWLRLPQVFVYGAVGSEGRFPIAIDGEPLSSVVRRAGGFSPRANLAAAHILRPQEARTPSPREGAAVPALDDPLAEEEKAARSAVDTVAVACDFVALFTHGDAGADVMLHGGDIVEVPEDRAEVRVVGHVRRPASYPFRPGADVGDYIRAAGGYDKDADKGRTRVAPYPGAALRRPIDSAVTSGAVIFVPPRERTSFLARTRDYASIIVQLASLVVIVDRLAR